MFNGPFVAPSSWPSTFSPSLVQSINNQAIADGAKVPPCALAAIVMRESGGQNIYQRGVPPGPGCGVGVTQITFGVNWTNESQPTFEYNGSTYQLNQIPQNLYVAAAAFLAPAITQALALQKQWGDVMAQWSTQALYWAFGIYNAGYVPIQDCAENGTNPNSVTTDDYCSGTYNLYQEAVAASGG